MTILVTVLVEMNVLIDVLTDDPAWASWSLDQLERHEGEGLVINPVIYSELSFGFEAPSAVDEVVRQFGLIWKEMPRVGLFQAAQAFKAYRKRKGIKAFVWPDFFIGGHAQAASIPLLTRDVGRYPTYFPKVRLITPEA